MDDVGKAFCNVMAILAGSTPDACESAWEKGASGDITQETLNEYLDETYGAGLAHKTKQIILTVIEQGDGQSTLTG